MFETNSLQVFMWKLAPYGKSSVSIFQQFLASIENIFLLALKLGTTSLSFWQILSFPDFSLFPKILAS